MTKPAGAGHSDDLAEYVPCPACPVASVEGQRAASDGGATGAASPSVRVDLPVEPQPAEHPQQGRGNSSTPEAYQGELENLRNEVKYADKALGGNSSIHLCDRIFHLKKRLAASRPSVEGQRTGEGACDKCGKPVFWHGDSWYHVNGSDVMKCGAASVPGVEGMGAREWREEFPCTVTHQSYPEGTTCLDCRDYALANNPPHRFTPDFRQRYIDYDRELFCYNCWSCIKSRSLRGAGGPDYPADELCQVAIENPDMQVIVKELTAELKEDFAIAYSLSNGEFDGLEDHLWMLVHLARKRGAGGEREPDWKKLYEEMRDFSKTWQAASESREQALAEELQSMTELTQSWFKKNRALEAELKAQTEWRKVSEAAESREQAMRENLKVSHNVLRTELGRKCDIQREDGLCEICRKN